MLALLYTFGFLGKTLRVLEISLQIEIYTGSLGFNARLISQPLAYYAHTIVLHRLSLALQSAIAPADFT